MNHRSNINTISKELKGTYNFQIELHIFNKPSFWSYLDENLQELIAKKGIGFKYSIYHDFNVEVVVWIEDKEVFDEYLRFYGSMCHTCDSEQHILNKIAHDMGQALKRAIKVYRL